MAVVSFLLFGGGVIGATLSFAVGGGVLGNIGVVADVECGGTLAYEWGALLKVHVAQ